MPPVSILSTSATWLALVAATTLGSAEFGQVRARIQGNVAGDQAAAYRLVVHSYAPGSVNAQGVPGRNARPIGSAQRSVTPDELSRGVLVNLMQIGNAMAENPVLVAWVELGEPTLELDALTARPAADAIFGVTRVETGSRTELVLASRA